MPKDNATGRFGTNATWELECDCFIDQKATQTTALTTHRTDVELFDLTNELIGEFGNLCFQREYAFGVEAKFLLARAKGPGYFRFIGRFMTDQIYLQAATIDLRLRLKFGVSEAEIPIVCDQVLPLHRSEPTNKLWLFVG